MPPKKPPRANIKSHFALIADSLKTSRLDPQKLTVETLQQAYGLASTASGDHLHLPACPNQRLQPSVPVEAETIIIDSEEEQIVKPAPVKTKAIGKGKGKAKAIEEVCSAGNCLNNPKCLNWLGQDKWENSVKALEAFQKAAGLGYSPARPREVDLPVGLRNLGATCYVNSLLQVWFQDETFRAGVYACLPPANGNVIDSPLFQLQLCFAFLQSAQQSVYDPSPLVASLKLDATEQQDVQEFSKLFMNLLDHEFKKQENMDRLVSDQFEGQITYGTECSVCKTRSGRPNKFFELEVNLRKDCKLEDRIVETLKEEDLAGDNQYYCEVCSTKVDATRYTVLDSIPPVLHFSLLRFVFSAESLERAKSNHAIAYPLKLDMGQYLPPDENGERPSVWYDLKGVLMHKGQSAHHGHYVAQVYDTTKSKWFLFDDEVVSSIDDLNAPDKYDEEEEVMSKKSIKNKLAAGFTRGKNGDVLPKSKDAYMLVYTRRTLPPIDSTPVALNPPPLALSMVENLDEEHTKVVSAWDASSFGVLAEFEKVRDAKRSVYRSWDVQDGGNSYLVNRAELKRWMSEGLTPVKVLKPQEKVEVETVIEVNESPDVSMSLPGTMEKSNGIGSSLDIPEEEIKAAEVDNSTNSITMITNHDLICSHALANPAKAEHFKRIGQGGVDALRELGITLEPELSVEKSLCRQCVWGIISEKGYGPSHTAITTQVGEVIDEGDSVAYISKKWYLDWSRSVPKMHVTNSLTDPNPSSIPWAQDVLCEHGKLQPDIKRRRLISAEASSILQSLFPDWEPVSSDTISCNRCDKELTSTKEQSDQQKALATSEKKIFRSFDSQTKLVEAQILIIPDTPHYLIPREFPRDWKRWSKQNINGPPRPAYINNAAFLCKHEMVGIDVNSEINHPTLIDAVNEKDWKNLQKHYDARPPIKIWLDDDGETYKTSPAICQPCLTASKQNFSTTELKIRILSSNDFDSDGKLIDRAGNDTPEPEASELGKRVSTSPFATRTSKRIKKGSSIRTSRSYRTIEMDKNDSVKDLRIKIQEGLNIPTIYQRIFYKSIELDSAQTVSELGLCGGDIIELLEVTVDEAVDFSLLDDTIDEKSLAKSKGKKVRREGFGNTGLLGFDRFNDGKMEVEAKIEEEVEVEVEVEEEKTGEEEARNGSSGSSTEVQDGMDVDASSGVIVACKSCTFEQSALNDECQICGENM